MTTKKDLGETADPEVQEEQREKLKLTQVQFDADLAWLLSSAAGRRVAASILRECKVGSVPFHPDERFQTFCLGQLNVGHWLLAHMKRVDVDGVRLMEDEEKDSASNRK